MYTYHYARFHAPYTDDYKTIDEIVIRAFWDVEDNNAFPKYISKDGEIVINNNKLNKMIDEYRIKTEDNRLSDKKSLVVKMPEGEKKALQRVVIDLNVNMSKLTNYLIQAFLDLPDAKQKEIASKIKD